MARIVNSFPDDCLSSDEKVFIEFVKNRLPDYISVSVRPSIHINGKTFEFDILLFIPHIGIIILEIRNCLSLNFTLDFSNGEYHYKYNGENIRSLPTERHFKTLKQLFFILRHHLKELFNITPLIYEFLCLPGIWKKDIDQASLPPDFDVSHVITRDDLESDLGFLRKIIDCTVFQKHLWDNETYEDLTDKDIHDIYFFWETGTKLPPRPERPPFVFLSYNRLNNEMSKDVQTLLEDRGIYVWRAPKDVPASRDYFPEEMAAIENCDLFLILLSSSAQNSEEVRKEFEKAVELRKCIFPVWVEDIKDDEINDYYKKALAKYQYRVMPKISYDVISEIVTVAKNAKKETDGDGA